MATFAGYKCWHEEWAAKAIDIEALQVDPAVFLATHTPLPILKAIVKDPESAVPYDDETLLRDFLDSSDYRFVAIVGGAGTGKSHLVRWLHMRISSSASRRVILIPRSGASLYQIIDEILRGLEGQAFEAYREQLRGAQGEFTLEQAASHLLGTLANEVEQQVNKDADQLVAEGADWMLHLPAVLWDPACRPFFLQPDGVLAHLARRVNGKSETERSVTRREWSESDFPDDKRVMTEASKQASAVLQMLRPTKKENRERAAKLITSCLDRAIGLLLKLGASDLTALMVEVRRELARRDVELVLLIEDLATLQGVDQQLLEAVIMRPMQPNGERLCNLRTAIAMTSGWYDELKHNIQQRFDFRVIMGRADTVEAGTEEIENFVAGYLNVIRLGEHKTHEWYRTYQAQGMSPVANACVACAWREPCHEGFGSREGIGLYPLTKAAVATIAKRVHEDGFNPRLFLRYGVEPLLTVHASDLEAGTFPPETFLGGGQLSPLVRTELVQRDPTNALRREAVLSIWGGLGSVDNLHPVIHTAFRLPLLKGASTPPTVPGPETFPPSPPAVSAVDKYVLELDKWTNGGIVSQDLMQELRKVVYEAVKEYIDWDAQHLVSGEFVGADALFRQARSINFVRQALQPAVAPIQLTLPLTEGDLPQTATALQGLLRYQEHGDWRFPQGDFMYRTYLSQVHKWASHVLDQRNALRDGRKTWDPVPAAVEMLRVGAHLMGFMPRAKPAEGEIVNAILLPADPQSDLNAGGHSPEWRQLLDKVWKNHGKIQGLLRARVACTKGGYRDFQILDVGRVVGCIEPRSSSLGITHDAPADLATPWKYVAAYQATLRDDLAGAVAAECAYQVQQYDRVMEVVGASGLSPAQTKEKLGEFLDAVTDLMVVAADAQVLAGSNLATLQPLVANLRTAAIVEWADAVESLRESAADSGTVHVLAHLRVDTALTVREGVEKLISVIERTEDTVKAHFDVREGGQEAMSTLVMSIETLLSQVIKTIVSATSGAEA